MTAPSTRRKILQSIGAVAAWAAVVGLGTFGTFSDPATPLTGIRDVPPHRLHPPSTLTGAAQLTSFGSSRPDSPCRPDHF
ncbi:MAG: hypothetical protein ABWY29_04105 [Blastococcus sp.]